MSTAVAQALYTKLTGATSVTGKLATATSIYHGQAPTGAAYPFIILSKASGVKTRAFRDPNAFNREVWLIKAVDRSTTSNLAEAIAEAVDALLDGGTITVSGKKVADLHHVSDVDYLEPSGDQTYRHHGANYALTLTAL